MATILSLAQSAADRIGIPRPTALVGSTNQQARELLTFAQQEGKELMKAVPWEELQTEVTFNTVAADVQTSLPSDFDRFLNDSMFNRTLDRKIGGPISPQEWQQRKAFPTASTVNYWFRVRGGDILFTPQPQAGEAIYYEYISRNWCQSALAVAQPEIQADTDTLRMRDADEVFILGLRWRFLKAKGLGWETPFQEYMQQRQQRAGTQEGAPTLNAAGRNFWGSWYRPNVPEGNWP